MCRYSGGVEPFAKTEDAYSSAASSVGFSTASTSASSIENHHTYSPSPSKLSNSSDLARPPPHATKRRPFSEFIAKPSYGRRASKEAPTPPPHASRPVTAASVPATSPGNLRTVSASTTSSASTATPPKIFNASQGLETPDLDDFAYMFDDNRLKSSQKADFDQMPQTPPRMNPYTAPQTASPRSLQRKPALIPAAISSPIRNYEDSSPASHATPGSQDRLLRSSNPPRPFATGSPLASPYRNHALTPIQTKRFSENNNQIYTSPKDKPEPLRLSPVKRKPPCSFPTEFQQRSSYAEDDMSAADGPDPTLYESAKLASKWTETKPEPLKPPRPGKVMTPSQFARYREEQEQKRKSKAKADDSDEDDYDDNDDVENDRKATNERRKQEAQLAVYRQSMMKVTGERPSPQLRSASNFSRPDSNLSMASATGSKSGAEDDDEDVPLGVLASNGFQKTSRPPTRSSMSPESSRLASGSPPGPSGGIVVGENHKRSSTLPPFARNLPRDPYMNPNFAASHGTLPMGSGASVMGVPAGTSPGTYSPHPSGLIGVIAEEERSRAMRRGSATAPGSYGSQSMVNLPYGMMPQMMSPGEQAQVHMLQQQNQMMHMQWQWMQQMQMQMSNIQGGATMPESSRQPSMSLGMPYGNESNLSLPNLPTNNKPGYAPSIAPSERSNVGLASRYRPVSMHSDVVLPNPNPSYHPYSHPTNSQRASTFTSNTFSPWSANYGVMSGALPMRPRSPTGAIIYEVNPNAQRKGQVGFSGVDDDDDEEGWAEMKKARDMKRRSWAVRKRERKELVS